MEKGIDQIQKIKPKNGKAIWYIAGFIIVGAIAFVGFRHLPQQGTAAILADNSNQKVIEQTVSKIKSTTTFPQPSSDGIMILNNVEEEPNAIRYEYAIHSSDVSQISNESLKGQIAPYLCTNGSAKRIFRFGYKYGIFV